MTILLYNYRELQERPARHLNKWKVCHVIIYVFAAVLGLMNYVFLQKAMEMVNDNCILFPRELEFQFVKLPEAQNLDDINMNNEFKNGTVELAQSEVAVVNVNDENTKVKRETADNETTSLNNVSTVRANVTEATENATHRAVLDISRTLFAVDNNCIFTEYMPLLSTVFAAVWLTMFTMCASGGRTRSGLAQPWRILAPALLFALVMVGLTGHNFTLTNGGIQAFCEDFSDHTNSTKCSAVEPFIAANWNETWGFSGRLAATRAASAGVWAAWACGAAVLLSRCLAAPDFVVRRTTVYLTSDPQKKIIPYLKKSQKPDRSNQSSPVKEDNISTKSDPTIYTELVTASIEQAGDSAPSSLMVSPIKTSSLRKTEEIEMTPTPQEHFKSL